MRMKITRRQAIATASAMGAASAMPTPERYQLGAMSQIYRAIPLDEALERIRRSGFRYLSPGPVHAAQLRFTPEMAAEQRNETKRKIRDAGLTPCMSLGGFSAELAKPGGLDKYLAEIDLCAEFGIRVMVGGGPWYFQKFPTLPKRNTAWQKEDGEVYCALENSRHT